jgi:predicted nuclease of predicted toxin-antitoxin system
VKIKLDENMPVRLVKRLSAAGHDTDTVRFEGLSGQPDNNVWQVAQGAGRFFITQDLDFSDLRKYQPGKHQGLLLVRPANPSRRALIERVSALFATEDVEGWRGCFVVAIASVASPNNPCSRQ